MSEVSSLCSLGKQGAMEPETSRTIHTSFSRTQPNTHLLPTDIEEEEEEEIGPRALLLVALLCKPESLKLIRPIIILIIDFTITFSTFLRPLLYRITYFIYLNTLLAING